MQLLGKKAVESSYSEKAIESQLYRDLNKFLPCDSTLIISRLVAVQYKKTPVNANMSVGEGTNVRLHC